MNKVDWDAVGELFGSSPYDTSGSWFKGLNNVLAVARDFEAAAKEAREIAKALQKLRDRDNSLALT